MASFVAIKINGDRDVVINPDLIESFDIQSLGWIVVTMASGAQYEINSKTYEIIRELKP